ncbi:hypothetical protein DFH06DRAFT_268807 [Mycena polygramma]|nr:hypothetical protein DFH06DRAFT_268807 [Mycena polygramma]
MDKLQSTKRGHRSSSSAPSMSIITQVPAVVLPTEILADIFMMCLPPDASRFGGDGYILLKKPRFLRPSEAPLLIASICRRWREVAISTPLMWLSLDLNSYRKKRDLEGVVSAWIERSLPYPLSFTMDHSYSPIAMKELNQQCERWSIVELCVPECDPFVFDEVRGRLHCLEKLYLNFEIDCPHLVESFAEAPQLKVVRLNSGSLDPLLYPISSLLPWHQLTSLTLEEYIDVNCIEILRQCSLLVDCCFSGDDAKRSGDSILSLQPIVHHHITSLNISENSNLDTIRLLELPSLCVLELELGRTTAVDDAGLLVLLISRSCCQLDSLILWRVDDDALIRCLPCMPSLVTLKLRTHEWEFLGDQFLNWVTHDLAVLPNLRELDIDACIGVAAWTGDSMRGMILSRCAGIGVARSVLLETFRLVYKTNEYDGDETGLIGLADELRPLLPAMKEFDIRSDSKLWM